MAFSLLVPLVLTAISSPMARVRYWIVTFAVLFVVCIKIHAFMVCREEPHPQCVVGSFSGSGAAQLLVLIHMLHGRRHSIVQDPIHAGSLEVGQRDHRTPVFIT